MLKRFLLSTFVVICSLVSFAQPGEKSVLGKAKSSLKITTALQQMDVYNYRGAMVVLHEVLNEFKGDAEASFLMAQCLYELHNFKDARAYLDTAMGGGTSPTASQWLIAGKVYHSASQLDLALEAYNKTKTTEGFSKDELPDVNQFIRECEFAKKAMASPVSVSLQSLGTQINSTYEDYAPVLSPDGKTIYFTSRRPVSSADNKVDKKGDFKFFEDIYESNWSDGKWQEARLVEGEVNTDKYDAVLALSPNGEEMYVYVNDGLSGGDIFSSINKEGSWSASKPVEIPINSGSFEGSVAVTPDGNTVFFMSERPGGYGRGDLWKIEKNSIGEWDSPVNLGPAINTQFDEKFVWIHPDGKTLFFASDGHQGLGSYDIYRSTMVDGKFTPAINLGYPINTTLEESTFSFSADKKTMYLAAFRADGLGERDIYQVDVSRAPIFPAQPTGTGVVVIGTVVTDKAEKIAGASIGIFEALTNKSLGSTTSNQQGAYELNIMDAATDCIIRVQAPGFISSGQRLNLKGNSGKMVVKDLVLKNEVAVDPGKPEKPEKESKKKSKDEEEEEEEETESDD